MPSLLFTDQSVETAKPYPAINAIFFQESQYNSAKSYLLAETVRKGELYDSLWPPIFYFTMSSITSLFSMSISVSMSELASLQAQVTVIQTFLETLAASINTNVTEQLRADLVSISTSLTQLRSKNPIAAQEEIESEVWGDLLLLTMIAQIALK